MWQRECGNTDFIQKKEDLLISVHKLEPDLWQISGNGWVHLLSIQWWLLKSSSFWMTSAWLNFILMHKTRVSGISESWQTASCLKN